jgi:cell division protein FtsB
MGSVMENVKTVNSAVRTALLTGLVGIFGYGGYYGYSEYTKNERTLKEQADKIRLAGEEVEKLNREVAAKVAQIEKLETAMHLLKTDQRLAQLRVVNIERNENGKAIKSQLEFVELSPQGEQLSKPKQIELLGDLIYVDNWIIKFDDRYVEKGDIERGTSLCLFRRVFSEDTLPAEGITLDEIGMRPQAYSRGGAMSDFEKKLWGDFWEFANDPKKAAEMGIRAANGEAVSIKVREGKTYSISLRASGGLSIAPIEAGEPQVKAATEATPAVAPRKQQ